MSFKSTTSKSQLTFRDKISPTTQVRTSMVTLSTSKKTTATRKPLLASTHSPTGLVRTTSVPPDRCAQCCVEENACNHALTSSQKN